MSEGSTTADAELERKKRSELAGTIERRLADIEHRWLERVREELLANADSIAPTDL